jgi:hypothetical protein
MRGPRTRISWTFKKYEGEEDEGLRKDRRLFEVQSKRKALNGSTPLIGLTAGMGRRNGVGLTATQGLYLGPGVQVDDGHNCGRFKR